MLDSFIINDMQNVEEIKSKYEKLVIQHKYFESIQLYEGDTKNTL